VVSQSGSEADSPYVGDTSRSPVVGCTLASIVCAFLSVGIIAAYLPRPVPLTWPVGFLIASVVLLAAALGFLLRRRSFAWWLFFRVARWVLVLTLVFTAMAVYVFVLDGTPVKTMAIMAAVLLLTAIDIPVLIGFSVARHERT
jgi:hypothetical protein